MKCITCEGSGKVIVMGNQLAHYDGWEDPEFREEPCEDCGGSGKELIEQSP